MFNSAFLRLFKQAPLKPLVVFSLMVNGLLLIPSWYMLEVYDRVVMSRNIKTLLMLALVTLLLLLVMEWLNNIRQSLLYQAGLRFVLQTQEKVFDLSFYRGVKTNQPFSPQAVDQLKKIQTFFASPTLVALLDLPFALIFLGVIYAMSSLLGHLTLVITLVILVLTLLNERATHPNLTKANQIVAQSQTVLNNIVRNAEVIEAMHMRSALERRWLSKHFDYLNHQSAASEAATFYQASSKLMQQVLGSTMLGMGCLLLLLGEFPVGGSGMIICSILATRFVSPLVQLISGWKHLTNAVDAHSQLSKLEQEYHLRKSNITLPKPQGHVLVEAASVKVPQSDWYILRNISLPLKAGQSIALIGPSGSGKTTLGRLLAGALAPDSGQVRLDGAPLFDWEKSEIGPYIGYLPQEIELQEGSIAQNISRFADEVHAEHLQQAVQLVGLHSFINTLPDGLETQVGGEGMMLPGGKKQLIGLARAIYGMPRLVVLDEPNSNLDQAGELALKQVLQALRQAGSTLVLITHHKAYLEYVDLVMVLMQGEVKLLGPKLEVMRKLQPSPEIAPNTAGKLT